MNQYYDNIASGYDELHKEEQLKKLELIRKTIQQDNMLAVFRNPNSLLDIGCGSGISTRFFDINNREGIDPSKELIKIAIKNDPKGKYLVMKAEQINYNKEFDLAISLTALQNFDDINLGLEKIKKSADRFILTFLKKSEKRELIEKLIEEKFNIIHKLEEDKDIIYFCE
ncbi:MAG: class I SAM-dependent methyltransferase [Candidatus Woesearchaeota archaeon]